MATKFLARPLQVLDRLYRFVEGQAPQLVELVQPVQLVHDVSRQVELGGPSMGLFLAGQDNAHVGAGTVEASWNPYDQVDYLYPNNTGVDIWVWLLSAWCSTSTANFTEATLAIGYAPYGESIPRRDRGMMRWAALQQMYDQNVAPATLPWMATLAATQPGITDGPWLVTPGSTMRQATVATGANTIRIEGLFWAGAVGSLPPEAA